mmetsp:Transcript_30216/g.69701  ORF Transcript_30216/g.69701 Transcript_30216/m.69701 type:complete len:137 (+) Transcript_30216:140-550(+)
MIKTALILLAALLSVSFANGHMVFGGDKRELESSPYSMCATIKMYGDGQCAGDVVRTLVFPTYSKPGQPCFHIPEMPDWYSLSNMYCTPTSYNQEVWLGTTTCDSNEHALQEYLPGKCMYGLDFVSCVPGPCPDSD